MDPKLIRAYDTLDKLEVQRSYGVCHSRAIKLLLEDAAAALADGRLHIVEEYIERSINELSKMQEVMQ